MDSIFFYHGRKVLWKGGEKTKEKRWVKEKYVSAKFRTPNTDFRYVLVYEDEFYRQLISGVLSSLNAHFSQKWSLKHESKLLC